MEPVVALSADCHYRVNPAKRGADSPFLSVLLRFSGTDILFSDL